MIHIDDLVNIFKYIHHTTSLNGIYNACNNNPVSNKDVMYAIAKKLHRYILSPPIPLFVLKLLFGDFVAELIADKKVIPKRLNALGFQFKFENFNQIIDSELD
jgi:NAD dependent epimerase/dehydratase family enzyme